MTAQLGDPAVEYWTSAMASLREAERRRHAGAGVLVLHLAGSVAVAATGYLGGHLTRLRTLPSRRQRRVD